MYVFDLKNCVVFEDRVFAWDSRTKSVVELEMLSLPVKEVPEEVLKSLLNAANERKDV